MVGVEGTNNVNLSATITFLAKLDQNSFNNVKKQIQGISGGGGTPSSGTPSPSTGGGSSGASGRLNIPMTKAAGGGGAAAAGAGAAGAAMAVAGAIGKGIEGIFSILQKMLQLMMDSSPLFQAVGKLFQTSMKLLFMPLGNMIAKVLMPIMMKYLQKSAERAQKYASSPPSSIEEVTSGTISDMISSFAEIFGKIFVEIVPPLVIGLVQGIAAAIGNLLGGNNDVYSAATSSLKDAQKEYDSLFSESGMTLVKSATGFSTALDQFGLTIYTSNNTLGKASSDLATTFYTSSDTIENGFNKTSTVLVYGTTDMIKKINAQYNLAAANVTTTFDTVSGLAETFGQSVNGVLAQFVDLKQPITNLNSDLGKLGDGLNTLASSIPLIIEEILKKIRESGGGDDTYTTAAAINWGNGGYANIKDLFSSRGAGDATVLNASEAESQLGIDTDKAVAVWKSNGAYVITDYDTGEIIKEGWYDEKAAKAYVGGSMYTVGETALGFLSGGLLGGTLGYGYGMSETDTVNTDLSRRVNSLGSTSGGVTVNVTGDTYGLDKLEELIKSVLNSYSGSLRGI